MSQEPIAITTPLSDEVVASLHAGDRVRLEGIIYVARDAAHKRFIAALDRGEALPFDIRGQVIYYMGPSPARPGHASGSAGPTTSYRMDAYTPRLLALGLKGMLGKGQRSPEVREAIQRYRAVYFAAVGGAAALIAQSIVASEVIAYEELGAEAVRCLGVEGLPAVVANDMFGGDVYELGRARYRRER